MPVAEKPKTTLLQEMDSLIEERIRAMNPKELKAYRKALKKIKETPSNRARSANSPQGIARQERLSHSA